MTNIQPKFSTKEFFNLLTKELPNSKLSDKDQKRYDELENVLLCSSLPSRAQVLSELLEKSSLNPNKSKLLNILEDQLFFSPLLTYLAQAIESQCQLDNFKKVYFDNKKLPDLLKKSTTFHQLLYKLADDLETEDNSCLANAIKAKCTSDLLGAFFNKLALYQIQDTFEGELFQGEIFFDDLSQVIQALDQEQQSKFTNIFVQTLIEQIRTVKQDLLKKTVEKYHKVANENLPKRQLAQALYRAIKNLREFKKPNLEKLSEEQQDQLILIFSNLKQPTSHSIRKKIKHDANLSEIEQYFTYELNKIEFSKDYICFAENYDAVTGLLTILSSFPEIINTQIMDGVIDAIKDTTNTKDNYFRICIATHLFLGLLKNNEEETNKHKNFYSLIENILNELQQSESKVEKLGTRLGSLYNLRHDIINIAYDLYKGEIQENTAFQALKICIDTDILLAKADSPRRDPHSKYASVLEDVKNAHKDKFDKSPQLNVSRDPFLDLSKTLRKALESYAVKRRSRIRTKFFISSSNQRVDSSEKLVQAIRQRSNDESTPLQQKAQYLREDIKAILELVKLDHSKHAFWCRHVESENAFVRKLASVVATQSILAKKLEAVLKLFPDDTQDDLSQRLAQHKFKKPAPLIVPQRKEFLHSAPVSPSSSKIKLNKFSNSVPNSPTPTIVSGNAGFTTSSQSDLEEKDQQKMRISSAPVSPLPDDRSTIPFSRPRSKSIS